MVDILLSPFVAMEAPLKVVPDGVEDDEDCLFDSDDVYSQWGLLTPPWSPCDSSMDTLTGDDCSAVAALADSAGAVEPAAATTRTRCDSFLCSCTSCECSCLEHVGGPVLRDCMWSQTTGLLPPPMVVRPPSSDPAAAVTPEGEPGESSPSPPCCPAITPVCSNHTARCVDPRNVFPCQTAAVQGSERQCVRPAASSRVCLPPTTASDCSTSSQSPVYDPDSETSAYCSAFSDDELEEIDVVSVPSCAGVGGWSMEPVSLVDHPPAVRRQVLVLPAAESMSAQVAAMHNYSNPRCRPPVTQRPSALALNSCRQQAKCAGVTGSRGLTSLRSRRRPRRAATTSGASSPASDWSSDSGTGPPHCEDERHRRAQHNVMERQRRYHLKSHFYSLRDVVPGTRGDGRVSKVAILRRAVEHVRQLATSHDELQAELGRQRALQERWKWKLSLLNREARGAQPVSCDWD